MAEPLDLEPFKERLKEIAPLPSPSRWMSLTLTEVSALIAEVESLRAALNGHLVEEGAE